MRIVEVRDLRLELSLRVAESRAGLPVTLVAANCIDVIVAAAIKKSA